MSDFHFLRPECILLILPLAALFFLKQIKPLKAGNWQNVISPKLQQYMLIQNAPSGANKVINIAFWLSALLAILALAGPSWQKQSSHVYHSNQGLVIALDLSLSMTAQDTNPSRLQRAKFKIMDILDSQKGKNIGLVAYAGDAHVVSPLTQDINTIKSMLPALDPYIMPSPGSNLVKLAQQTATLFEQSNSTPRTLLLVTDGVETEDVTQASDILNQANIQLAILAVGTEQGAPIVQPDGRFFKDSKGQVIMPPLEWDTLSQLASQSSAHIEKLANSDKDINRLLASLNDEREFTKNQDDNIQFDQWMDSGYWLILPLLLLTLAAFRKGVVLSLLLMIMWQPQDSYAQTQLPDIFLNGDQKGAKYFANKPKQAAEYFNNPQWKASSLYKSGDYQGALNIWKQYEDVDSLYNKGNALAHLQQIDQAIAAYDAALAINPDHADAKANKALLEKMQNQNQQNSQQNQDSDNSQKNQENQQQSQQGSQSDEQQNQKSNPSDVNQQSESGESSQEEASQAQQDAQEQSQQNANPLNQAQSDEEKQKEQEMEEMREQLAQQNQQQQQEQTAKDASAVQSQPMSKEELEQQQAMQQWMQRIPDDPGGLLRNKFLYQYQQRNGNTESNGERKPW